MTGERRNLDPRLLIPIVGVLVVLALVVFLLFLRGGDDAPGAVIAGGGANAEPASGAPAPSSPGGGPGADASPTDGLSVAEAGRQALIGLIEDSAVEFEPTQGERRNNAQTQIVQRGVPAAGQEIRVFAWQDEEGHVVAAVAEGESVAGRLCGLSISYLDGSTHLDGSVDVKSRPDCDAPSFYQSPIESTHEPGISSGVALVHVVRSAGPLPEGAAVHIWAFVAVGDGNWDNVGYTCDQQCSQSDRALGAPTGDPETEEERQQEREAVERGRQRMEGIRRWMEEVRRARGNLGLEAIEEGEWALAAAEAQIYQIQPSLNR